MHEVIDWSAMQNNVGRIKQMVQTETGKYSYMKRKLYAGSYFGQQTLFDMEPAGRDKEKLLMELPEGTRLMMNGCEVTPSFPYLMDNEGNVYAGIQELDAAVLSENSIACDENGELLSFSVFDAKRMKVLSMESAMEQLGMDIGW